MQNAVLKDETLLNRVREIIAAAHDDVEEKKAFGGIAFMVNSKMWVGVKPNRIMVRIDPGKFEEAVLKEGCEPMVHSGKIMKGFIFVNADVTKSKKELAYWIKLALEYNKIARPSRKK